MQSAHAVYCTAFDMKCNYGTKSVSLLNGGQDSLLMHCQRLNAKGNQYALISVTCKCVLRGTQECITYLRQSLADQMLLWSTECCLLWLAPRKPRSSCRHTSSGWAEAPWYAVITVFSDKKCWLACTCLHAGCCSVCDSLGILHVVQCGSKTILLLLFTEAYSCIAHVKQMLVVMLVFEMLNRMWVRSRIKPM